MLQMPNSEQSLTQLKGYFGEGFIHPLIGGYRVGHLEAYGKIKTRCTELLVTMSPEQAIKQLLLEIDQCNKEFHGDW